MKTKVFLPVAVTLLLVFIVVPLHRENHSTPVERPTAPRVAMDDANSVESFVATVPAASAKPPLDFLPKPILLGKTEKPVLPIVSSPATKTSALPIGTTRYAGPTDDFLPLRNSARNERARLVAWQSLENSHPGIPGKITASYDPHAAGNSVSQPGKRIMIEGKASNLKVGETLLLVIADEATSLPHPETAVPGNNEFGRTVATHSLTGEEELFIAKWGSDAWDQVLRAALPQ